MELVVGRPHPSIPPGQPDAARFSASSAGLELIGTFDQLKPKEVKAWERGRLRLAPLSAGDHTLFVLYELDGFAGWSDAPFSLGLVPPDRRALPPREAHQGRLLHLTLLDGPSAVVRALRAVSLSPAWCGALETMIAAQADRLATWSRAAHDAEREAAASRWPDCRDMVRAAPIVETAGRSKTFAAP